MTVGMGDFYPISNTERLLGSFLMLFGVMTSDYIMGALLNFVNKVEDEYMESNFIKEEGHLDRFFHTLEQFNRNKPIDKNMYNDIR